MSIEHPDDPPLAPAPLSAPAEEPMKDQDTHENRPLDVLLELHGPQHLVTRVAAFLRHDAYMLRNSPSHCWDVPETMAKAYENAARLLDEHLAALSPAPLSAPVEPMTREYPCGFTATGGDDLPLSCPIHGSECLSQIDPVGGYLNAVRELTSLRSALRALREWYPDLHLAVPAFADRFDTLLAATGHLPARFVAIDPVDGTSPEGLRAQEPLALSELSAELSRLRAILAQVQRENMDEFFRGEIAAYANREDALVAQLAQVTQERDRFRTALAMEPFYERWIEAASRANRAEAALAARVGERQEP